MHWLHHLSKSQGVTTAPVAFTRHRIISACLDWKIYAYAVLYISIAVRVVALPADPDIADALLCAPLASRISHRADGVSLFLPTVGTPSLRLYLADNRSRWSRLRTPFKALARLIMQTNAQASLFSVPPYAVGFVTTIITAWISDRISIRGPVIMFWMTIAMIGYAVSIVSTNRKVLYGMSCASDGVACIDVAVMIAGGVSPSIATAIAYVAANFGPLPKRAIALGLFFSVRDSCPPAPLTLPRSATAAA